jgi:VCBS repeat-containing protein
VVDVVGDITEGATLSDTGSITFADLDLTDLPTATEVTQSVTTNVVGGLTGAQQTAIENAFSISPDALNANNGTINWTYSITEGELDFLAAGETVTATFTITVNDGNGGTDTQDVTINITGSNDAPVITPVDVTGAIMGAGTVSEAGSITFADLDLTDLPTATEVTQSVTTNVVGGLTGAQQTAIENAFTISAAAGNTNNGTINWDYTIADADLDFLAAGETVTVVFTITVDDGNGGTDTQNVTINITGSNDAPIITPVDVTGIITEGGTVSEAGSLTFTDLDLSDLPTASEVTQSVTTALTLTPAQQAAIENAFTISAAGSNTNNGTIIWDYTIADADLDFLASGETVTVVFTITVDDGNGGIDTQDVTINITGANDTPVISVVDVTGNITEHDTISETGSITFADLDLTDLPTATEVTQSVTTVLTLTPTQQAAIENAFTISAAASNTSNGSINWDYSIAPTDLDFLAVGDTVTVVFTITVNDGNGGTDTQDVTINITGANDVPVIGGVYTATLTEDVNVAGGMISANGSLTISDLDAGQSSFVATTINSTYGTLTIDTAGNWSYSADNTSSDIQSLRTGMTLVDSIAVTAADGTSFNIVIRIDGAEDAVPPSPADDDDGAVVPPDATEPLPLSEPPEAAINQETVTAIEEFDAEEIYTTPQIREPGSAIVNDPDGIEQFVTSESSEIEYVTLRNYQQDPVLPPEIPVIDIDVDTLEFQVSDDEALNDRLEMALLNRIELMRMSMDDHANNLNSNDIEVKVFIGATTSLTAGIVSWVLRGGSLLASLMGTVPLLNRFDPLPILKSRNDKEDVEPDDDEDDTEITGPVGERQKRVDNMFSDQPTSPQQDGFVDE